MRTITLAQAQTVIAGALAYAREQNFKPLGVAVLDVRGALTAYAAEDGATLARAQVAMGKAGGAIAMGMGSRTLAKRGRESPQFVNAVGQIAPLGLIPVPGGVLIRSGDELVGAVGISGDNSDNDEAAALAGIRAAGLTGDPGTD
ncbi:MAG TPA: heme-binding protein [Candidatus Lustribacter sp.]